MLLKKLGIFAFSLVCIGSLIQCSNPELDTKMTKMKIRVDELSEQNETLQASLDNMETEYANLKRDFNKIDEKFRFRVEELLTATADLENEVLSLKDMKKKITKLEDQNNTLLPLKKRVDSQQRQLDRVQQSIKSAARSSVSSSRKSSSSRSSKSSNNSSAFRYTVRSGDNLGKIATRYGVSIGSIKRANNLRSSTIRVGQVLLIPNK